MSDDDELDDGTVEYRIPTFLPTQLQVWRQVEKGHPDGPTWTQVVAYVGGWASGKSTVAKWVAFDYAMQFAGIRILFCRQTLISLELSTMQELKDRMTEGNDQGDNIADVYRESWSEKRHTFSLVNGSQIVFGGLDKPQKWSSTQFGLIVVEEASETMRSSLTYLKSRLRQPRPPCPNCGSVGCVPCRGEGTAWVGYRRNIVLVANHTPRAHWIPEDFVGAMDGSKQKKPGYVLFETSSWENHPDRGGHLDHGYLESMTESEDASTVSTFMGGEWGSMPAGTPVYSFVPKIQGAPWHLRKITFNPAYPIIPSFDFGYRFPYVTLHQIQERGKWRVLAEFTLQKVQTDQLCRALLDFMRTHFAGYHLVHAYGDHAGRAERSEGKSDASTVEEILGVVFRSVPSTEFNKKGRRKIVARRLKETIEDEPLFAIDSRRCAVLAEGLAGMYRYPDLKASFERTNYVEEPVEQHPYVDVIHSLEYFALMHFMAETATGRVQAIESETPGYAMR